MHPAGGVLMTAPPDPNLGGWQTSNLQEICRSDEAAVRRFLQTVHSQAARAFEGVDEPGYLQLVRIHPDGGAAVPTQWPIGDIEGTVKQALADASFEHNVYVEGRTVKKMARGRGKSADTVGVFAFVIDRDADKGRFGTFNGQATISVETSPGNRHEWLLLTKALLAEKAKPIGEAIRSATGADTATGVITQPYRVAGTPNFPSATKKARGRGVAPTRIIAGDGPLWTLDDLTRAFQPTSPRPVKSSDTATAGRNGRVSACLLEIVSAVPTPKTSRSNQFHRAVKEAIKGGITPADLEHLMRQHPDGCAGKYFNGRGQDRLSPEIQRSWRRAEEQWAREARNVHHERQLLRALRTALLGPNRGEQAQAAANQQNRSRNRKRYPQPKCLAENEWNLK
jgi:hypothetical protein